MRDLMVIAKFTIKDTVKKKSFLIANIIILLLIVFAFNIPNIMKLFGKDGNSGNKILVVDKENIYEDSLSNLEGLYFGYNFEVVNNEVSFEEIKEKIEQDEINNAIILNREGNVLKAEYIVKNLATTLEIPADLQELLLNIYRNVQITKLGLTEEQLSNINPNFEIELKQTEEQEVHGNIFVLMLASVLLFYAIYFCAYQVSVSVTTEKTSRIIETLVTATKPRNIVIGKTLGIGLVGIVQVATIIAVALISKELFLEPGMLDSLIDFSQITPMLGVIVAIYFICGYSVYALLYAVTGSAVSKPEDVQSANTPVMIVTLIAFYLSYFSMTDPTSTISSVAAYIPLSSPFSMPIRVMMGIASWSEILISVAILLVTILIIAKISIKIYSQAILNTGNKLSLKDVINMYKNKNI